MKRPPRNKTPLRDLRTYGGKRAPRLLDCDYKDDEIVHLTICASDGTPFADPKLAALIGESAEFYCKKLGYSLYGYCVMPDHVHVLLSPNDSRNPLSKWLQAFKSFIAHRYVKDGGAPPLWQRSAYDHVCRKAETVESVLAYIAENPVRAGLVKRWRDWRWTRLFVDI